MPLDSAFSPPRRLVSAKSRRSRVRSRRLGASAPRLPFGARGSASAFWIGAVAVGISLLGMANGGTPTWRTFLGPTGSHVMQAASGAAHGPERRYETPKPSQWPMTRQQSRPSPEMVTGCR